LLQREPRLGLQPAHCGRQWHLQISRNPSSPGMGILVVTGQMSFTDNPYNGIILAIG
jgi:hypothetical protein